MIFFYSAYLNPNSKNITFPFLFLSLDAGQNLTMLSLALLAVSLL